MAIQALRADFQGDTFACLCLCLGGGESHSKAAQSDSPIHSNPHFAWDGPTQQAFYSIGVSEPGLVKQEVPGAIH